MIDKFIDKDAAICHKIAAGIERIGYDGINDVANGKKKPRELMLVINRICGEANGIRAIIEAKYFENFTLGKKVTKND